MIFHRDFQRAVASLVGLFLVSTCQTNCKAIGNSLGSVFTQIAILLFVSSFITGKNTACNSTQWTNLLLPSSMRILPSAGLRAPAFHIELLSISETAVNQTSYLASLGNWLKEEKEKKAHRQGREKRLINMSLSHPLVACFI